MSETRAEKGTVWYCVRTCVRVVVCGLFDDKARVPEWLYRSVAWSSAKVWVAYSGVCIALCGGQVCRVVPFVGEICVRRVAQSRDVRVCVCWANREDVYVYVCVANLVKYTF